MTNETTTNERPSTAPSATGYRTHRMLGKYSFNKGKLMRNIVKNTINKAKTLRANRKKQNKNRNTRRR